MKGTIYFIGKPYPLTEAAESCLLLGYKIGLLLDASVTLINDHPEFDHIILVDFSSEHAIINSVKDLNLKVSGLICTYENYIMAKSILAAYFDVEAQSVESANLCTDKFAMRQAFMDEDAAITPKFKLINSEDDLTQISQDFTYPVMIKPTNLVKSLLVMKCNNQNELLENYRYAQAKIRSLYEKYHIYDREPHLIAEEFIQGNGCSVAAFIDKNGIPHFCEGIVSLISAQEMGINDNYLYARMLPASITEDLSNRIFDVASKGVTALKMKSTAAHIEMIYDGENIKIVEIGARIGGYRPRMYSYSYGTHLIEQEIRLALGEKPILEGSFQQYCAVFELFPETEGEYSHVVNTKDTSQFTHYTLKAKPGKIIGPAKRGYKASAVIIISQRDKTAFEKQIEEIKKMKIITKK